MKPFFPRKKQTGSEYVRFAAAPEGLRIVNYERTFAEFWTDPDPIEMIREEQKGRMFAVRVGPTFADARRAYAVQIEEWREAIEKIIDLFMRMDTNQAEVAVSVLFGAMELPHQSKSKAKTKESEILQQVMTWKQRRRPPLDSKEVALAVRKLNMLRWINAEVSPEIPLSEEEFLNV